MAFGDEQGGGYQKPKFTGDWKCGMCGAKITELPFEPKPERLAELKCKECWQKNRPPRRDGF